jgi:hypothetical protein
MYQEDSGKNIIKEELEDIKGVIALQYTPLCHRYLWYPRQKNMF